MSEVVEKFWRITPTYELVEHCWKALLSSDDFDFLMAVRRRLSLTKKLYGEERLIISDRFVSPKEAMFLFVTPMPVEIMERFFYEVRRGSTRIVSFIRDPWIAKLVSFLASEELGTTEQEYDPKPNDIVLYVRLKQEVDTIHIGANDLEFRLVFYLPPWK